MTRRSIGSRTVLPATALLATGLDVEHVRVYRLPEPGAGEDERAEGV